ncbi:inhibitor of nuclear factor kappa-B kinase-interacting protein isoform X3 [Phyllopteryx taeniolatus]|uniref:inhibitor of nuclear factor kappa-B kinase-interacting protein isoform X3 n=1 Tax=Phyllopteryx taeniolatus TaxID=161469 RepID=UPI002AD29476|nr:inhibitor of nuclear factor kappa-B kinase-interacting protein isoform X3 [Phyllopteryx taeniolatus]
MPAEVKQRKKKQSDEVATDSANKRDEDAKVKREHVSTLGSTSSLLDLKCIMCVLSLAMCAALSWMVLQQNARFSQMEEKFTLLYGKTSSVSLMEEQVERVRKKCESAHLTLADVGAEQRAARAQLESLARDVGQLKEWASGLSDKRSALRSGVDTLAGAVDQIEARTSAITVDFANKVASVRTDVRRMDGLRSELEALLTQVSELEERSSRAERSVAARVGDVLAGSIERVSGLRAASERNAQALQRLGLRLHELDAADRSVSERLRELEGGRARLIRTVSFAGDLKPKVAAIKRDFGALEPRLADLTFRLGSLAEDLGKREEEVAELRRTLDKLTSVEQQDVSVATERAAVLAEFQDTAADVNARLHSRE